MAVKSGKGFCVDVDVLRLDCITGDVPAAI